MNGIWADACDHAAALSTTLPSMELLAVAVIGGNFSATRWKKQSERHSVKLTALDDTTVGIMLTRNFYLGTRVRLGGHSSVVGMRYVAAILVLVALVAVSCGGGSDIAPGPSEAASLAPAVAPTATPSARTAPMSTPAAANAEATQSDDGEGDSAPSDTVEPADEWTVMIYVMGDNDLEPFAVIDLLEMAAVDSNDAVNVVALVDRAPEYLDEEMNGIANFEDTRIFYFDKDELGDGLAVGELNTGDPEVLANFIASTIADFPAKRYATILWNHGAGWPGVGPDETDGFDILDLADIDQAFEMGLAAAGLDSVDLVGFDACLMASYEVATTMAEHADFMLASEELEPGHGWNYMALQALTDQPDQTAEELGASIIDGFVAQAADEQTGYDITLSLLDLSAMGELEQALDDLAAPLIEEPGANARLLATAQAGALKFATNPDPELESNQIDLGDFVRILGESSPELAASAGRVNEVLSDMVIANSTGPASAAATGLSVYFPANREYFRQGYLFLDDIPVWQDLLTSFYTAGDAIPQDQQASFVQTSDGVEVTIDDEGLSMFATFDATAAEFVVDATLLYGVLDETDDSIIFLGEQDAEFIDETTVFGFYDLTVLMISDGIDTEFAYLDFSYDEEGELLFFDVPMWYFAEDAEEGADPVDVILNLVLDFEGNIVSEVYYAIEPTNGTVGELTADPEGLMFPIVLNQYPNGESEWLTLSEAGLFARLQDLTYELVPLDPGTGLHTELIVTDYGGNTDSVSVFQILEG
ncbi:MAG: hypothetical protein ACI9BK_000614 [Acidimicrobiales bacterium]|jgi:hypothetical protein